MFKKLAFAASLAVLVGCSDSGGSDDDNGNNNAGGQPTTPVAPQPVDPQPVDPQPVDPQPVDPQPVDPNPTGNPSGGLSGAWFGATNFGEGVVVVDAANRIFGLSQAGSSYEAIHGTVGSPLERFFHRDSDNPAHGDSFTLVGDPALLADGSPETVAYNLSVAADGQQLNNAGGPGNFSLTFATTNDLAAIDAAGIAGDWIARTSFCASGCDLALNMSFAGTAVTGSTVFDTFDPIGLNGEIAAAADSSVYMNISFAWNDQTRAGIIYRDRANSNRLILNTVGEDGDQGNRTFTAILSRP